MAASEPPAWQPPSRRQKRNQPNINPLPPQPDSRSARNRQRRERSMERQFSWLFALAVGTTILYLMSRTPLGLSLIRGHL
ncbi:MAG: hypothetical protein M1272_05690 [Firmicutes bacterium]|nr:hypothetical protein [Bacillota bacterium]